MTACIHLIEVLELRRLFDGQYDTAFSTDGRLASGNYTALDDPKHIFGFQYVAPIVKQSVLDAQGPEFAQTLDCVSSLLTTTAMQALNKEVQVNGGDPGEVAKAFLNANKVVAA